MDGIEAAREIQHLHPLVSFIFVSAYLDDPSYQERVRKSDIRVGGWLEKPLHVDHLVETIDKELKKASLRLELTKASRQGISPAEALSRLSTVDLSLSSEVLKELLEEIRETK